jgi:alpha-L-arabinofuranosidase
MDYTLENILGYALTITLDDDIVEILTKNNNKRVVCTLNDTVTIHCALIRNKGEYYIMISKAVCKQLGVKLGDTVQAKIEVDTSEYQFSMPDELDTVLQLDDLARNVFESLTKGKQRSLMHLVSIPKSQNKRIERALLVAEKLKQGITSAQEMMKREE